MPDHLGLDVGGGAIRAVLIRRGHIAWRGEQSMDGSDGLRDALTAVLTRVPRRRLTRLDVTAALGVGAARVKRLEGIPLTASPHAITAAVKLNPRRFFVEDGAPLLTSPAVVRDGAWWCAALEATIVTELASRCRAHGLRLLGCLPAASVLGLALLDGVVVWGDGAQREEITLRQGSCVRVHRRATNDAAQSRARAPLSALGDDAVRFAAAFGAAVARSDAPFLVDPAADARDASRRRALRAALTASIACAIAGAAFAPGLRALWVERTSVAAIARMRERAADGRLALGDLADAARTVKRVNAFLASRRSATLVISSLASALPESTAVVSIRLDSAGGAFVTLAPVGAAIVPSIAETRDIAMAHVVGAVTREMIGGTPIQRASIGFSFRRTNGIEPTRAAGARP